MMINVPEAEAPHGVSDLRFLTELIAWVATPWALASHSIPLAVLSVIVLIGLPTVFGAPGDKATVAVAVPGWVTIGLVLLQLVAAAVSSWLVWPLWVAVVTWALCAATVVTEARRWRWLAGRPARLRSAAE
jgi:hypothetical protein